MYTAIIKFNTLTDTVWSSAKDHDLWFFCGDRVLIQRIVRGIIISSVFGSADMYAFPCFFHTEGNTPITDFFFRNLQNLADVFIGETIFLCRNQKFIGRKTSFIRQQFFFLINQFFHLLDKIRFNLGQFKDFFDGCPFTQGFIHQEMSLAGWSNELL